MIQEYDTQEVKKNQTAVAVKEVLNGPISTLNIVWYSKILIIGIKSTLKRKDNTFE